ncbi:MAG: PEP/pyruvate-binding domain-containing protein [Candidatus Aminicenantales bacterium]
MGLILPVRPAVASFDRHFFTGKEKFTAIGRGDLGGKAHGLALMRNTLENRLAERFLPDIQISIPTLTVIATGMFDLFIEQNDLHDLALSSLRDDLIAGAFQKADLPAQLVGDLRALIAQVQTPLAVRSSSLLEDAMFEPFASVYATKMIPNNQMSPDSRFKKLVEAVKFVYASTFFKDAKNYIRATKHTTADEKMAVIIQEVVGVRHGQCFYPHISGVARSFNFYPLGHSMPAEGIIDLALGLGKAIVDDGIAWSYSPAYPRANPPYNTLADLLTQTQSEFWAINLGWPAEFNPIKETEYMMKFSLEEAEKDGVLQFLASTYRAQDDKIVYGIAEKGPRVIDFAPILKFDLMPLNALLKELLKICEDTLGRMVEIEFALTLDERRGIPARFGFLQVRPMVVSSARVSISAEELVGKNVLLASESALGNGVLDQIKDIVYVKPERFNVHYSETVASELERLNHWLVTFDSPYLLIGLGRWGTSDPQAGIPVNFGQICGAKVIVECALPETSSMLSQGSHFFHNITSFRVFYFSLGAEDRFKIDWDWIQRQPAVHETDHVRHVRLPAPLTIKVDGTSSRGVIHHG